MSKHIDYQLNREGKFAKDDLPILVSAGENSGPVMFCRCHPTQAALKASRMNEINLKQ